MQHPKLITIEDKDLAVIIDPEDLINNLDPCGAPLHFHPYLSVRGEGEFQRKAFYLDVHYDWVLGTDSEGVLVLLPLHRDQVEDREVV